MARDFAQIKLAVWDDPDFVALTVEQQHAYFQLVSSKDLSWCGVLDWVPKRFIGHAKGLTLPKFAASVRVLERRRFVVIDHDTDELLVRTYVRHSGLLSRGNMGKPVARSLDTIHSDALQATVLAELGRLYRERPGLSGWSQFKEASAAHFATVSESQSGTKSGTKSGTQSGTESTTQSPTEYDTGWGTQ